MRLAAAKPKEWYSFTPKQKAEWYRKAKAKQKKELEKLLFNETVK
jgi:hypothetical protein